MRGRARSLLLLGAALAACGGATGTALRVTVTFDAGVAIDQLRIEVGDGGDALVVPRTARSLSSGGDFVVLVPDEWAGTSVVVKVTGLAAGAEVGRGEATAVPRRKETVAVAVALCADECTPGTAECVVDQVRRCQRSGACARWLPPEPCPVAQPYCADGTCAAQCQVECTTAGARRCWGAGYQLCGYYGTNPCLRWGPTLACGESEVCRASDGTCVADCGGAPCPCTAGDTQPCADVGECRSGVRSCEGGEFGACIWQVGPTAEVCDGQDNDCNGQVDDGLAAPACPLQAGVCAGAVKRCGGSAGWLACTAADYLARSSAYETTETLCDGKDNDCDGATDEPAACCQGSCSGKACGADDGCGNPCQTGSCPPNASCWWGECWCEGLQCGSSCCALGDVCDGSTCCTPSCGSRECGIESACGSSCGTCAAGTCSAQGKCETWSECFAASDARHWCWNYCIDSLDLVCKGQCSGLGFDDLAAAQAYTLADCQAGSYNNVTKDCYTTNSFFNNTGYYRCCCAP